MKRFILAATVAIAAVTSAVTSAVSAETWDMATPYGVATFHTQNIREFAKDVFSATDGAVDIKIHSAGSLFPHSEIRSAVRSGQIPLGEIFLSRLSNEDAAFGIDSQPFLATSYEDAERLWKSQRPVVSVLLRKQGLIPLFSVPWPAQGLYTNGEITSTSMLKGLRFRAYNATLEEFSTLVGAAPVQVDAPDIPQAFATGQIEAMITSASTGANSKAWDFVTHFSPINAWLPKNIVVVNARIFGRLPESVQQAVRDAAEVAEARGWEMSRAEASAKTAIMRDNGVIIYPPSPELTAQLQMIGKAMLKRWNENSSDLARSIITGYNQ